VLTSDALLEVHERAHRNTETYLAHAKRLDPSAADRRMPEFNGASVRLLLHHAIGAESFWIGVLEGRIELDEEEDRYPTIESLEAYREITFATTEAYLHGASPDELNTPRSMFTDPGVERVYRPGHVVMRTITHLYHHQGQVAVIFRLLGKPVPRTPEAYDYPIT